MHSSEVQRFEDLWRNFIFLDRLTGLAEFGVRSIYNLDIILVTRAACSKCELEIRYANTRTRVLANLGTLTI